MQKEDRIFYNQASKLLSILLLIAMCCLVFMRIDLSSEVNSQIRKLAAAGLPVNGAELNAWRKPIPDSENGALMLTQAFALKWTFPEKKPQDVTSAELLARTNAWSPETMALVSEYVQMNSNYLDKVRNALRLPAYRFPADFSYGLETPLPHLKHLKELGHIIALRIILDAINDAKNDWRDDVELLLKLATTLDGEPSVVSQLVRKAILITAVKSVEKSLNMFTPDDEALARLQEKFAGLCNTNLLPFGLIGDRACNIPVFRMSMAEMKSFDRNNPESPPDDQPRRLSGKGSLLFRVTGIFERDLNFYLQTMDKAIALSALPAPECLVLTNLCNTSETTARENYYFFSSMLMPSLSKLIIRETSALARIRLAQTALALERFRKKQGRLPGHLTELAPDFVAPADPFTGKPILYRLLPAGYVIYSVDQDGFDNQGREAPWFKKFDDKSAYDITLTVER